MLHNHVWAALMILIMFPLFAVGTVGLTYLAEQVGRLIEARRRKKQNHPNPYGVPLHHTSGDDILTSDLGNL